MLYKTLFKSESFNSILYSTRYIVKGENLQLHTNSLAINVGGALTSLHFNLKGEMYAHLLDQAVDWNINSKFTEKMKKKFETKEKEMKWRLARKAAKRARDIDEQAQNVTTSKKRQRMEKENDNDELVYVPSSSINKKN